MSSINSCSSTTGPCGLSIYQKAIDCETNEEENLFYCCSFDSLPRSDKISQQNSNDSNRPDQSTALKDSDSSLFCETSWCGANVPVHDIKPIYKAKHYDINNFILVDNYSQISKPISSKDGLCGREELKDEETQTSVQTINSSTKSNNVNDNNSVETNLIKSNIFYQTNDSFNRLCDVLGNRKEIFHGYRAENDAYLKDKYKFSEFSSKRKRNPLSYSCFYQTGGIKLNRLIEGLGDLRLNKHVQRQANVRSDKYGHLLLGEYDNDLHKSDPKHINNVKYPLKRLGVYGNNIILGNDNIFPMYAPIKPGKKANTYPYERKTSSTGQLSFYNLPVNLKAISRPDESVILSNCRKMENNFKFQTRNPISGSPNSIRDGSKPLLKGINNNRFNNAYYWKDPDGVHYEMIGNNQCYQSEQPEKLGSTNRSKQSIFKVSQFDVDKESQYKNECNKTKKEISHKSNTILLDNGEPAILFNRSGYPLTDLHGKKLKNNFDMELLPVNNLKELISSKLSVYDCFNVPAQESDFNPVKSVNLENKNEIQILGEDDEPVRLFNNYGYPLSDENGVLLYDSHGNLLVILDCIGTPICCVNSESIYVQNGQLWIAVRENYKVIHYGKKNIKTNLEKKEIETLKDADETTDKTLINESLTEMSETKRINMLGDVSREMNDYSPNIEGSNSFISCKSNANLKERNEVSNSLSDNYNKSYDLTLTTSGANVDKENQAHGNHNYYQLNELNRRRSCAIKRKLSNKLLKPNTLYQNYN